MLRRLILLLLVPVAGWAQSPLNPPAPLAPIRPRATPGTTGLTELAAERAQALGFPDVAAGLYRQLLAQPGGDRRALELALATALLDDNRGEEAEKVLNEVPAPRGSAWHLRAGLAAVLRRRLDPAKSELAAVKLPELSPADRPWYFFLQGMLASAADDPMRAGDFYRQAEEAASTDLLRARFFLAQEQSRLRLDKVNAEMAEKIHENAVRFQGQSTGYDFARAYAVMLDQLGRKNEAIEALRYDLLSLPAQQRSRADDFRLLLGLIAGAAEGAGRNALVQLLETGADSDRQRVALQLLARASPRDPAHAAFRGELDRLIAAPVAHPILDDLILMRAQWALGDKDFGQAEESAHSLLEKFPGSPLRPYALGVLAGSNWEQYKYRAAADYARQIRDLLPLGPVRVRLGVVVAEAWFRAGDFRSAADAYAAVLTNPPPGIPPGDLIFQQIEAELRADEEAIGAGRIAKREGLRGAEAALDREALNPAFDVVNRWEAEWNFARAVELNGQVEVAYARVNRLLAASRGARGLTAELRARMGWLQARLSYDVHDSEQTLKLVDALLVSLDGLAPPALRAAIASNGELLKAEACFDLKREATALEILKKLRTDYPRADAAVSSYFVEAEHYAQQDKVVEAQQLLTRLADEFPKSPYAPYALYQAAYLAERLGQDDNLVEANRLIERLVSAYPDQDIVFDARLKQGDLFRKLNQFPQAQQAYESLINNYARNPNVILADLALAECHNAQSASDPSHEETARSLFEDLCARVDASVDVRVEAGFNLGLIYERRGQLNRAAEVWWRDVVTALLLDPANAGRLEGKGRYWMARTLYEYGSLLEKMGRLDQAEQAWRDIINFNLSGQALARANLARAGSPSAAPASSGK